MKKVLLTLLLSLFAVTATAAPGDVIVKFKDKNLAPSLHAFGKKVAEVRAIGAEVWRPDNEDELGLLEELRKHPSIEWAELDLPVFTTAIPNDTRFPEMWAMNRPSDIDIDAPEAWDTSEGEGVVVAIIDTGCDITHPDLAANIWVNPNEVAGNGIDDDANGYIDDINGWDFYYNTPAVADTFGHGTHTAGTVGAVGNNNLGVIGVAPKAKLMILKGFAANGAGNLTALCNALIYSADMGAKISSNSWVTYGPTSQLLTNTINYCQEAGQLVVFAAANNGMDIDCAKLCPGVVVPQPASYTHPALLVVAASQADESMAGFSNYGIESVDLGAPGSSIISTYPTFKNSTGYNYSSGTSMACPHVAGAAALLLSNNPSLTAAQLKFVIMDRGDPTAAMAGRTVSGKRLNVNFWSTPLDVKKGNGWGKGGKPKPPGNPSITESGVASDTYDIQGRRVETEKENQLNFSKKYKRGKRVVIK